MGYFPLCLDIKNQLVLCIGSGAQIKEKTEKLLPFGAIVRVQEQLTKEDLQEAPALVIVGDTPETEAEQISRMCKQHHIPVNVVDKPALCTFFFPALISKGDLTVSVSTGGVSPMAAGILRRQIEDVLPDHTEEILQWLGEQRSFLREQGMLKPATEQAFFLNRPLTEEECLELKEKFQ